MVLISLLFSAHTFYVGMRKTLFQNLRSEAIVNANQDDNFQPAKEKSFVENLRMSSRKRFLCLLAFIIVLLLTFSILILVQDKPNFKANEHIFSMGGKVVLGICEGSLYLVQLGAIIGGVWVFYCRIRKLNKTRPVCPTNACTDDDEKLCIVCSRIVYVLDKRLPILFRYFAFVFTICLSFFLLYTS